MVQILVEDFPSYAIVKWAVEFKLSRDSTDDHWSGHPKTSTTDEQVDDICLTVQQIAKSISISSRLVHTVLIEILRICKLSARYPYYWNILIIRLGF